MKKFGYMETGGSQKVVPDQFWTGIGKYRYVAGIKHDHDSFVSGYLGIGSAVEESRGDQCKVMRAHGMYGMLNKEFLCARQKVI